jgi:hypothetical protein
MTLLTAFICKAGLVALDEVIAFSTEFFLTTGLLGLEGFLLAVEGRVLTKFVAGLLLLRGCVEDGEDGRLEVLACVVGGMFLRLESCLELLSGAFKKYDLFASTFSCAVVDVLDGKIE